MKNLYNEIRKEFFVKMRLADSTIKGIKGSQKDMENKLYNEGIRDCICILDKYKDRLMRI